MDYIARVIMCGLYGVVGYFGLWLCGMPAKPIGYLGAALVSVAVLRLTFAIGRAVKEA